MDSHPIPFSFPSIKKISLNKPSRLDLFQDNQNDFLEGSIYQISFQGMDSSSLSSEKYITKANVSYTVVIRKRHYTLRATIQSKPPEISL